MTSNKYPVTSSRRRLLPLRLRLPRVQRPLQIVHGLFQALVIFDQSDADEAFAVLAEGAAGGEGNLGLVHHPQAEVERPLVGLEMGGVDLRPDEHARLPPV